MWFKRKIKNNKKKITKNNVKIRIIIVIPYKSWNKIQRLNLNKLLFINLNNP